MQIYTIAKNVLGALVGKVKVPVLDAELKLPAECTHLRCTRNPCSGARRRDRGKGPCNKRKIRHQPHRLPPANGARTV